MKPAKYYLFTNTYYIVLSTLNITKLECYTGTYTIFFFQKYSRYGSLSSECNAVQLSSLGVLLSVELYFVSIASYRALLNLSKSSRRERSVRLSCTFIYAMPRCAGRLPAAYENSCFVEVIVPTRANDALMQPTVESSVVLHTT